MRLSGKFRLMLAIGATLVLYPTTLAQNRPSSIQLFMPNNTPSRVLRITLVREDGYVDTVFTDSRGKYEFRTPPVVTYYSVTIETDNQTYGTTSARIIVTSTPSETPIFLKPYVPPKSKTAKTGVVDVTTLERIPEKARAAYDRGIIFAGDGKFSEAIPSLEEAIKEYPSYVAALNDLGVVLMKLNRLDDAAARFRSAIGVNKRHFHARMNLGLVLNRQGKYREALEILEPLSGEKQSILAVRRAYARALIGDRQIPAAEKIYRSMLNEEDLSQQDRATLQFELGFLLNRQGRYNEAATELQKAVDLDTRMANAHLQLGGALMQLGNVQQAEYELLKAYELAGPSAGGAQFLLGLIYYRQGRDADAQRAFEQYLRDIPAAPNVSQVRTMMADLRPVPPKQ